MPPAEVPSLPRWLEVTDLSLIYATYTSTNPLYNTLVKNPFAWQHGSFTAKRSLRTRVCQVSLKQFVSVISKITIQSVSVVRYVHVKCIYMYTMNMYCVLLHLL